MTDQEPFKEFIEWWDDPKVQAGLAQASDYTKAKQAFYAAWAAKPRTPGWRAQQFAPPGPPPVAQLRDYSINPTRYTPTDKQPALRDQYPETATMSALPDDTNPGFAVIEHTQQVWDGDLEPLEPGHEG